MNSAERAQKVLDYWSPNQAPGLIHALLPEGAIILTREEAEQVRVWVAAARRHSRASGYRDDAARAEAALALLSAGQPGQAEK